jgi:hypothetical protein
LDRHRHRFFFYRKERGFHRVTTSTSVFFTHVSLIYLAATIVEILLAKHLLRVLKELDRVISISVVHLTFSHGLCGSETVSSSRSLPAATPDRVTHVFLEILMLAYLVHSERLFSWLLT